MDIAFVHDPEHDLDQAVEEALPALIELREKRRGDVVTAGVE